MNKKAILKWAKYSLRFLSDSAYIKLYYRLRMHESCRLDNPVTYNEKLQWLKLHDRNSRYVEMVDKAEAKKIAASLIGEEHIVPTLGVWDSFEEIDFSSLPDRFVLKCTHDSEGLVVVKDKSELDVVAAKRKLERAMRFNFYYIGRELPYLDVPPRIIAEEYIEDSACGELRDYKFFCFNGEPKLMFVATGRASGDTKFDFYDLDFKHLDIVQHYPNSDETINKPTTFNQMIEAAKVLSKGIPHVRIDFYEANGVMYFGEFTFYHFSGFMPFEPDEWNYRLGNMLDLPSNN